MRCKRAFILISLGLMLQNCDKSVSKNIAQKAVSFYSSTYEDPRDHRIYKVISYGNTSWLAENLRYDTLSFVSSDCMDKDSCEFYGRFYSRYIAEKVCPPGWHLPSDEEWKSLESAMGIPAKEVNRQGIMRGINVEEETYTEQLRNMNIKFHGTCAYVNNGITHKNNNYASGYWSSPEKNDDSIWVRIFYPALNIARIKLDPETDSSLYYIRCVKD